MPHVPPQASEENRQTPEEQQKLKQCREKNRVAASRCREKRKKWIEELENQVKLLQSSNMNHEVEVTRLRIELEKCKALLLKHRDCSVTRAENQDITQVLAETPSKVWTDSSDVTNQRVSKPVTQAIVLEENQSAISTKTSLNAMIQKIPEKLNKTITSTAKTRPLNSVSRNSLSNSSALTSGVISGELNSAQSPRDPLLNSTVACGGESSSPPPGIPIITNVGSITLAEEESFMKAAQVINVGNSEKYYLVNMPIAGHPNVPNGELKLGSAQENTDEPWTERVLSNSVQVPKTGIFIIVKNISEVKETEAQTSTQMIQVPEISIMDNEEIPLSLEKTVAPVEEMMVSPETSRDEDDEVVFVKEIPQSRV